VRAQARRLGAVLVHRWRGSLQTRVVATTLVLSGLVAVLLGFVLLHQIRSGLLDARTRASLTQLDFGLQHASDQFNAIVRPDPSAIRSTARTVIGDLAGRGSEADSYGVVLLSTDPGGESENASDIRVDSIPQRLLLTVSRQGREAWTWTSIVHGNGSREPGLVVGGPVQTDAAGYQLYYLFPLRQEGQTLYLVERTMVAAGVAMVLLLAAIAALVTRQVVRPVRQAAATAERLAAGRLRDRMPVRGEDDLASLATSFNRMAETVERQISQLRELSRVQRRFVADVSHELRTPVTTIRMAADVLHDSRVDLPPELARSAELLQTQLDRFELLLGDLLEISRHDAGAVVLEAEPVDLRALVLRVVEAAEPIAMRRGCPLEVDLPPAAVVAEVDPRRIERVLRNLVVNAVEHGAGRPVEVRLRGGAGGVAVSVRDHGRGLRPGEAALVFGRFWRADPARARTSGGTGLGLSIALEDTRLHRGWLQAWGQSGEGSLFRLTLPWRAGSDVGGSPLPLDPTEVVPPVAEPTSVAEGSTTTGTPHG
jgi:two-component system, OmpR family, sensor histidine kinase MtrB